MELLPLPLLRKLPQRVYRARHVNQTFVHIQTLSERIVTYSPVLRTQRPEVSLRLGKF